MTLRLLGEQALLPGEEGFVRLRLPVALPLVLGDRYVLREHGRSETVGGGEVLDVAPVLPAAKARPSGAVDAMVAERGWVDVDDLEAMTGWRLDPTAGRWVVAPDGLATTATSIREAVAAAGPLGLDVARLDARQRAVLTTLDDLSVDHGLVRDPATCGADALVRHPYLAALEGAPFAPPPAVGVDRADLRELMRRGLVVEREGVWFASSAIERATRLVAELLAAEPGGFTTSRAREAFGTSRRYALLLLAHLDAIGATRRRGDMRVAAAPAGVPRRRGGNG